MKQIFRISVPLLVAFFAFACKAFAQPTINRNSGFYQRPVVSVLLDANGANAWYKIDNAAPVAFDTTTLLLEAMPSTNTWPPMSDTSLCPAWMAQLFSSGIPERGTVPKVHSLEVCWATGSDTFRIIRNIGVGWPVKPFKNPVVFITVDSVDLFGELGIFSTNPYPSPLGGYVPMYAVDPGSFLVKQMVSENVYRKPCVFETWRSNTSAYSQDGFLGITGNSSVHSPLRSLGLYADAADLYDLTGDSTKCIKLRAGGSSQWYGIGMHETASEALKGLGLGTIGATPVNVFVNGHYYGLLFAQVKPDEGARDIGLAFNSQAEIDSAFFSAGASNYFVNNVNYGSCVVGGQTMTTVMSYDGDTITELASLVCDFLNGNDSAVDWKLFARYLAATHFFELQDSWVATSNNLVLVVKDGKIAPIIRDLDFLGDYENPFWQPIVAGTGSLKITSQIMERLLDNAHLIEGIPARSYLARTYQDMLNTKLGPKSRKSVRKIFWEAEKDYEMAAASWPGVIPSKEGQEQMYLSMKHYLHYRPEVARTIIRDSILAINEPYGLAKIILDSVPQGMVRVDFNTIDKHHNWQGRYLVGTTLDASIAIIDSASLPIGSTVVFKEYETATVRTVLSQQIQTLTLTPVMRLPVVSAKTEILSAQPCALVDGYYDLLGRRLETVPLQAGVYMKVENTRKTITVIQ